jgi:nicotinamidase-related amidase
LKRLYSGSIFYREQGAKEIMKPALLVIDAQKYYFAPYGKSILPDGEKAMNSIVQLVQAARDHDIPIMYIVHEAIKPGATTNLPGTIDVELHDRLDVRQGDVKIVKHFPGSFTQTDLEARLRLASIDTVIICGYMTHQCCDTTTRQASERLFDILFASDATASRDLMIAGKPIPHHVVHETTLAIMTHFAQVIPTDEIVKKLAAM